VKWFVHLKSMFKISCAMD